MSLDRLIDLAKNTGDRIIVHDPVEGKDVVLLDVDTYEHLMFGRRNVHKLSESQLLDQINRDIAVWRAGREMDEFSERTDLLDEELRDHPLPDPFEEDFAHSRDWHSAGSVLQESHRPWIGEDDDDREEETEKLGNWDIGDKMGKEQGTWNPATTGSRSRRDNEQESELDRVFGDTIPRRGADEEPFGMQNREPLPNDEPVFYEEPV